MAWNINYPADDTVVRESTDGIRENWDAIEKWLSKEHVSFNDPNQGRHRAGEWGVLYSGISSLAPTGGDIGGFGFFSDLGVFALKRSSGFERITNSKYSQLRQIAGSQVIEPNTWTTLSWTATGGFEFDTLGEFTGYSIMVKDTGRYWVIFGTIFPIKPTYYTRKCALTIGGSIVSQSVKFGTFILCVDVVDILYVSAGTIITPKVWHNYSEELEVGSASLHMMRVG